MADRCDSLVKLFVNGFVYDVVKKTITRLHSLQRVCSVVELCQSVVEERGGSSGLSVLRTFRLLRILKLVRFLPNLRRQLFVMLRTMDNVAVFFSLLVLFIFIFR